IDAWQGLRPLQRLLQQILAAVQLDERLWKAGARQRPEPLARAAGQNDGDEAHVVRQRKCDRPMVAEDRHKKKLPRRHLEMVEGLFLLGVRDQAARCWPLFQYE